MSKKNASSGKVKRSSAKNAPSGSSKSSAKPRSSAATRLRKNATTGATETLASFEDWKGSRVEIHGVFDPAFAPVFEAFVQNFKQRNELGAAICIYQDGVPKVDLWGGHKDPGRRAPWTNDTIVGMASVVKGMLAMALHLLADRGKLDYDAPVAQYWPEFAQNGKENISVRQAISHHAAIHFVDAAQPGDFFRWDRMVAAIAKQTPEWRPGTRGVYHTVSIIFILGKLIQCASGEYPWDFFRREITEALGVDYHIHMHNDVMRYGPDFDTEHFTAQAGIAPDVMARFFAGMGDPVSVLTSDEVYALPGLMPGGNARGCARLFSIASMNGALHGRQIYQPCTLDLATEEQWHEPCAVWGTPMRSALGLLLNNKEFFYIGPNPRAFGTAGGGGSFAMADRESRLSISYSLNRWWPALALGDRARALIDAAYASE